MEKVLNLKTKPSFDFKAWISGDGGLKFAIVNSILFLMANYAGLLNQANPYMEGLLIPASFIATIIYIQESFFFGVVTIVVMIQAQRIWIKQLFCVMEGLCVFLYFSKNYIDSWTLNLSIDGKFALSLYVAIFSGIALYSLGIIFSIRLKEENEGIVLNLSPHQRANGNGKTHHQTKSEDKGKKP